MGRLILFSGFNVILCFKLSTSGETKNLLVPVITLTHNFDKPIVMNDNEKISLLFFIFFAVIFSKSM